MLDARKSKAIEFMGKLDIYKPYIKAFKESGKVCFFERFGGYWAEQEPEVYQKMKELEKEHEMTVYAITHEYTQFGECWSFLFVNNEEEEWETLLMREGSAHWAFAYVWNKSDDDCSEFGTIGLASYGGGIRRIA